jgi:oligopeptide/dipeptide ABC transporter ATP-binding protein
VTLRDVRKRFTQGRKSFWGLDGVSLTLEEGRTYALVGESGSGKSTLALSLMVLQDVDGGEILYKGENLVAAGKARMQALRREIRMLFQHPEAVLNSGMTIEAILSEGLEREGRLPRDEIARRVAESLEQVRLDPSHAKRYPSNLSSGEKQRVTIARALITRPRLLVCDEPVASMDLAIQSQIMALLQEFQSRLGLTYLFISHNLELVKLLAHRIGVMYMGKLIEESSTRDFTVDQARHPYTRLLLASVPSMGDARLRQVCAEFPDVEPVRLEGGCPFRNRCPLYLKERVRDCETTMPPLREFPGGAKVACHLAK